MGNCTGKQKVVGISHTGSLVSESPDREFLKSDIRKFLEKGLELGPSYLNETRILEYKTNANMLCARTSVFTREKLPEEPPPSYQGNEDEGTIEYAGRVSQYLTKFLLS